MPGADAVVACRPGLTSGQLFYLLLVNGELGRQRLADHRGHHAPVVDDETAPGLETLELLAPGERQECLLVAPDE